MKGWEIFVHSVRLVLRNLESAFRISAVLYLAQVANQILLFLNPPSNGANGMPQLDPETSVQVLFLSLLALISSLWIAVAWHRFVLVGEEPQGWLPRWHGSNMLNYLGRSIMIGFVVLIALLLAGLVVGMIALAIPAVVGIFGFGLVGLASYLFFRMGVMLPASAMGERLTLGQAWSATKDSDGAIVVLAFIVIGVSVLLQVPSWLNANPDSIINLIYNVVTGWFVTIIGISVLTTLYGHYVEGRPID